ncbi:MAG TPA: tetratricopeptide repeat protein, partial [Candidatus Polarisedimenticolia bacterium]|nr:tetratricopeptide repeat protein [Candidatus Polarisedimenticolia bacterium]
FASALRLDPYEPSALYNLGLLALEEAPETTDTARRARVWFERYLTMAPRDATGWMRLGQASERSGDLTRAEEAYLRGIELAPRNEQFRRTLEELRARRRARPDG